MIGVIFSVLISIGLPLALFVYACFKKRYMAFILGALAFVGSQILFRIPLLQFLGNHSTEFIMLRVTQPILFAIVVGLSAGIVEELARFICIRFFMSKRNWQSGFLFGAGHGGIEAVLFVGIPALTLFVSQTMLIENEAYFIGGIERFFAMILHIGLSIIVLKAVAQKRFIGVWLAIAIHGFTDALVGILPLYVPKDHVVFVMELALVIIALTVFAYSLILKRRGVLQ